MVRRTRIVVAGSALAVALSGVALPAAAGDRHATGSSDAQVQYTADGVPYVVSGPECRPGGPAFKKQHREQADQSDF